MKHSSNSLANYRNLVWRKVDFKAIQERSLIVHQHFPINDTAIDGELMSIRSLQYLEKLFVVDILDLFGTGCSRFGHSRGPLGG